MDVPLPRASSKRLINFFTFHISMFFSASFVPLALMVVVGRACVCASREKFGACRAGVGVAKRSAIGTPLSEARKDVWKGSIRQKQMSSSLWCDFREEWSDGQRFMVQERLSQ